MSRLVSGGDASLGKLPAPWVWRFAMSQAFRLVRGSLVRKFVHRACVPRQRLSTVQLGAVAHGLRSDRQGLGNAAREVALAATPLNLLRANQKEDGRREPRT